MGRRLGKYELIAEIARGGMGVVHLAFAHGPSSFGKLVVIKELNAEFVGDPTYRDMFLEEGRLALRLNHPNIVQTYEVGNDGSGDYLVMDYLEGVTLGRVLRQKSPQFTRSMHLRVLCDMLEGLEYAHTLRDLDGSELRVVHRDVNPANVFITYDGLVKLVDFGIAKNLDSRVHTGSGILKGKAAYMAPEQITGGVDRRADLYSTGVMLWEAVAGQRMWSGKTEFEVLVHVVRDQVPPLRELVPDVPEPLACIIDRAVAKAADDRFPSARALQEALEELLDGDREATTRAVKRTLNELFAEERTKRQLSIQAQLAELRASGSRSASYPRIESQPSLMPVQLGPSVSPAPMPAPSIPVLEPWRPPPASPSWRPPGIPRRALVRATAVAALVALSFFVGFRSKNANAPTRAAAVALDESRPLLPLDPAWPSIGPAPTLTPPPPPPSVAAPAWGFRTGAFVRPRAPVPTASSGPSADVAPPLPAATRPAPASVRIIGDKKTSVLVVE